MNNHIVTEGTFIPVPLDQFPAIPDQPMLNPPILHDVDLEHNYPFLDKSPKAQLGNFLIYMGIFCLVFPLNILRYGLKIKGKKNIRKNKKMFKNGAITISNHVYRWDYLAVLQAVKFRRMWFPARGLQVKGADAKLVRGAGGIPIPETISALKSFNQAFDELHSKKKWIHVFPESCRWDFYQPIRPFKKGAFTFSYKYDLPIIPMVISYRKPTGLRKLINPKQPLITLTVGEPVAPAKYKDLGRKECCRLLCEECHAQMVKMAGIEQNMWQPVSDL